jgi:hypothetical protein
MDDKANKAGVSGWSYYYKYDGIDFMAYLAVVIDFWQF